MRRKDREMDKDFAISIVDKCDYAVVSMVMRDRTPYCVPLSVARVGNSLYFHCAAEGQKIEALSDNPTVCVSCVGGVCPSEDKFTTEYESTIIMGKAQRVIETGEKIKALKAICERYTPKNMDEFEDAIEKSLSITDVWRIDIEQITGKRKKYDLHGKEMKFGRME